MKTKIDQHTKVALILLGIWALMFALMLDVAPSLRRWIPVAGLLIVLYIAYATVTLWTASKRKQRLDQKRQQNETNQSDNQKDSNAN